AGSDVHNALFSAGSAHRYGVAFGRYSARAECNGARDIGVNGCSCADGNGIVGAIGHRDPMPDGNSRLGAGPTVRADGGARGMTVAGANGDGIQRSVRKKTLHLPVSAERGAVVAASV